MILLSYLEERSNWKAPSGFRTIPPFSLPFRLLSVPRCFFSLTYHLALYLICEMRNSHLGTLNSSHCVRASLHLHTCGLTSLLITMEEVSLLLSKLNFNFSVWILNTIPSHPRKFVPVIILCIISLFLSTGLFSSACKHVLVPCKTSKPLCPTSFPTASR